MVITLKANNSSVNERKMNSFPTSKGVGMHISKAGDEETEDVVVDGDDTAAFGQPQFNENDIQSAAAEHSSQEEGKACKQLCPTLSIVVNNNEYVAMQV